jgi:hypothetical protein
VSTARQECAEHPGNGFPCQACAAVARAGADYVAESGITEDDCWPNICPPWMPQEMYAALKASAETFDRYTLDRAIARAVDSYQPAEHRPELRKALVSSPDAVRPAFASLSALEAMCHIHGLIIRLPHGTTGEDAARLRELIAHEVDQAGQPQSAEEIRDDGSRRPRCRWCGEPIPPERGPIAIYCRDSHRVAAAKLAKRERDKAAAGHG